METQLASLETLNETFFQIFKLSELLCELQNTRSSRPNEDVVTTIELVIKPSLSSMYTTFGSLQVSAQRPTSFLYMVLLMQCLYCVYIRKIQRSLKKEQVQSTISGMTAMQLLLLLPCTLFSLCARALLAKSRSIYCSLQQYKVQNFEVTRRWQIDYKLQLSSS